MQPAAAEVEPVSQLVDHRPGAAAEPRTRFDDEAIDGGLTQPARGGNAGRAAADHHDTDIATRHEGLAPWRAKPPVRSSSPHAQI